MFASLKYDYSNKTPMDQVFWQKKIEDWYNSIGKSRYFLTTLTKIHLFCSKKAKTITKVTLGQELEFRKGNKKDITGMSLLKG